MAVRRDPNKILLRRLVTDLSGVVLTPKDITPSSEDRSEYVRVHDLDQPKHHRENTLNNPDYHLEA